MNATNQAPSMEERRFTLDEERLRLDSSFARKWLPTLGTLVVGLWAAVFGWVQYNNTQAQAAAAKNDAGHKEELARIEAHAKDEREWGFKVVEMYFNKRELFDLTQNRDQALANLQVLTAVAPTAVQGLLNAERDRIPKPGAGEEGSDAQRLESLAAVAQIQSAIKSAKGENPAPPIGMAPSDFLVYIQYAEGSRDTAVHAQEALQKLGFRAPGMEQVRKAPSRLQVRYYLPQQKDFAGHLAIDLGKTLGLPATADNAVQVKSQKLLPSGILELWLPPAAAP
jgi:hypothetical protein